MLFPHIFINSKIQIFKMLKNSCRLRNKFWKVYDSQNNFDTNIEGVTISFCEQNHIMYNFIFTKNIITFSLFRKFIWIFINFDGWIYFYYLYYFNLLIICFSTHKLILKPLKFVLTIFRIFLRSSSCSKIISRRFRIFLVSDFKNMAKIFSYIDGVST
jgi:hypothetical protein